MAKLYINENEIKGHINPEIYGHFSEHLGRCIYEGLYVGEDSEIPNVNGMRKDVVEALKEMQIPLLRWPGRLEQPFDRSGRLHVCAGPPARVPGRCRSGGHRLPVQRPHPPRPGMAHLLAHRSHLRESLWPIPEGRDAVLYLLRFGTLGSEGPRRHAVGVSGA